MRPTLLLLFSLLLYASIAVCNSNADSSTTKSKWDIKAEEAYQYGLKNLYANPDSVIAINHRVEQHLEELSEYASVFNVFNIQGIGYQVKSEFETSNDYFHKADSIATKYNDTLLKLKSSHNLALNHRYLGKYEVALNVFLNNLNLAKHNNLDRFIGFSLSEIANVYILSGNYSKALEYQHQALKFHRENNNTTQIGTAYNSLSNIYSDLEFPRYNLDTTLLFIDSALKYLSRGNRLVSVANVMSTKCIIYGRKKEFTKCISCNLEVMKLQEKIGNNEGVMIAKVNIGKSYTDLLNHKKASTYFLEALAEAKKRNQKRYVQSIYESLAINYSNLANYELAYNYADSSAILEDSLRGERINSELADLEAKYQLADKERTILKEQQKTQKIEQEKEVAELRVEKRNSWILFLILLLISGATAVYLFIANKNKKQALREEALLREEKQLALKAVIEAQEGERKRIAKDLHDGIGQKLSGMKMGMNRVAKEIEQAEAKDRLWELSDVLETTAEEIRAISHKMMPVALREVGISAALKSMLEKTFQFSDMNFTYDEANVEGRFVEKVEVTIYRIAQELVNNAVKHSKAKEISVQLLNSNGYLVLIVQDDGKGVDLEAFKKGQGYMNINSRLSVNKGEINLESKKDQGLFAQVRVKI